jgi:hypothetical protein
LKENVAIPQILQLFGGAASVFETRGHNTYLLKVKQIERLFEIANQIYTSGLVKYAHPDFVVPIEKTNPLFPEQYYLNNTGQNGGTPNIDINAPEAWALLNSTCSANARIRVAVIDDGVEAHEDLNNLLPNGFTPLNPNGNGRPIRQEDSHGQACAGIIGANNNQIGIRGVATNVDILPINIFIGGETTDNLARAIDWAWNEGQADILSNSWGFTNEGISFDVITAAIQRARTLGRNGRGCAVVFASGNSNQSFSGVTFPANVEGVITVGAINNQGALWNYSSRGQEMDLVAPSGNTNLNGNVVTLDRMGANGYEAGNYTNRFGGTSAACPQVAGVAALMLQVNPNLTESQVREILQQTARDLGAPGFDNNFGYGLVDAQAAVQAVLALFQPDRVSGKDVVCSNTLFRFISPTGLAQNLTWQVSSNLQIVSGQGTSELSVAPIASNLSEWGFLRAVFNNTCTGQQEIYKSIWVGRPKIWSTILRNFSDSPILPSQSSLIVDTLYFQQACFGVVPPRPTYDKVCVSAQGASGVNIFEAEDIIGNASESFGYSSGSQTCSYLFLV